MPGGVRSMQGEKQMIYKNITFKAAPFSYDLTFDDRITLVGGDSGTGKTVLYEMLEDIRLTDEYKAIKLFNYKSDDFLEAIKQCRDSFIVIDNADCMINDDVRRFINFELSNQYMLFLRNCDGLNVSDKSFKVLKFDNNRITLEDVLSELDSNRQNYLLQSIHNIQTVITCTGLDELIENNFSIDRVFRVTEGKIDF